MKQSAKHAIQSGKAIGALHGIQFCIAFENLSDSAKLEIIRKVATETLAACEALDKETED